MWVFVWMCILACMNLCQSLIRGISQVTTFSWDSMRVCLYLCVCSALLVTGYLWDDNDFSWWAKFRQLLIYTVHRDSHTLRPMLTLPLPTFLHCFSYINTFFLHTFIADSECLGIGCTELWVHFSKMISHVLPAALAALSFGMRSGLFFVFFFDNLGCLFVREFVGSAFLKSVRFSTQHNVFCLSADETARTETSSFLKYLL